MVIRGTYLGEGPGRLPWWRRSEVEEITLAEGRPRLDALGASTLPRRPRWDADTYLRLACRVLEVDRGALSCRRKDESTARLRELVVLVGVEAYGVKVKECGEWLGMNPGSVSRLLARAAPREREDRAFHEQRVGLEERLAELETRNERPRR